VSRRLDALAQFDEALGGELGRIERNGFRRKLKRQVSAKAS